ncbi:probable Histone-lysine N-methyltransferase ATXR5 isoform X2 [Cryptomeria japonica]|nr:probable Histone-lysine N-methyltransferase ATXR5 isoform X2 [Cryptomeria japonica]
MGRGNGDGKLSKNAVETVRCTNSARKNSTNAEPLDKPKSSKCKAVSKSLDYRNTLCEECRKGDGEDKMLLCDKCDKGYHMYCLCPVVVKVPTGKWICTQCSKHDKVKVKEFPLVQTKIIDFFHIQKPGLVASSNDFQKPKKRGSKLVVTKKRRRLLPFVPTQDLDRRLKQMASLATALTSARVQFSDELTYMCGMAPRSSNRAALEKGGMQVMSKEDKAALDICKTMTSRGECPPLLVVYDSKEGFTVEADSNIKDLTIITEYTGDVDYLCKRENDDGDCMMTLLMTGHRSKNLVICPDKRGNIARFINGINNHTP